MLNVMFYILTSIMGPPEFQIPLERLCIRDNMVNHSFGLVRNNKTKNHQGHDYLAKLGSKVLAISNAKIIRVERHNNYGLQIIMKVDQNLFVRYAHLQSSDVKANDYVTHGQQIGTTGNSGNAINLPSDQYHLHFEAMTVSNPGLGLKGRFTPLDLWPHLRKSMFNCTK